MSISLRNKLLNTGLINTTLILVMFGAAPLVYAQEMVTAVGNNNAAYITKVFSGLVLVVALILVIAWLVRRFGQGTLLSGSNMKLISSMALGAKEKVVVVEIGERQLLLGVTSHSIQTLHKFETPLPKRDVKPIDEEDNFDFRSKIQEILSKNCLR